MTPTPPPSDKECERCPAIGKALREAGFDNRYIGDHLLGLHAELAELREILTQGVWACKECGHPHLLSEMWPQNEQARRALEREGKPGSDPVVKPVPRCEVDGHVRVYWQGEGACALALNVDGTVVGTPVRCECPTCLAR